MFDMLAARRRIMMAKKKPSFHVWDGTRDYSFYNASASTWYIETPEQWAGLCMVNRDYFTQDSSGLPANARDYLRDNVSKIEIVNDLYFNADYENNFIWEEEYDNEADKIDHNNMAYVLRADGQRVTLSFYALGCNQVLEGNFKKFYGLYASSYSLSMNYFIDTENVGMSIQNLTFANCTIKNGMPNKTATAGDILPSILFCKVYPTSLKNIQANHCMTIGRCGSNSTTNKRMLIRGLNSSFSLKNICVRDSVIKQLWDMPTNFVEYYEKLKQSGFIADVVDGDTIELAYTFNNQNIGGAQLPCNAYQTSTEIYGNALPTSESNIYTFGNTGTTTSRDSAVIQIMSSKAALIAQVNADITAKAYGDLSLLDADGNFTGVCP